MRAAGSPTGTVGSVTPMHRPTRTPVLAVIGMLSTSVLTVSLLSAPAEAARRTTRVSSQLSATVSNPGGTVAMVGKVKDKGMQRRTVVLEQKIATGWRKVDKVKSTRSGDYALTVPTYWFYSSRLRTRVVQNRRFSGDTSRTHMMSVVPAYVPLGSPSSWSPLGDRGDRWNPCRTLTYGINTSRATPDAATVTTGIVNTMALVSQATGVNFTFRGETESLPLDDTSRRKDPDIIFAFTTDEDTKLDLGPAVAARGGYDRSRAARDARGRRVWEALDGGVMYDLTDTATMTAAQFQQLTLHEVGHVMGLGHVGPTDQYMTAGVELYHLPLSYQAGDLQGFSKVGVEAGCLRPVRSGRRTTLGRAPVSTTITTLD